MTAIYTGAAAADPRAAAELTQALAGRREGLQNFTRNLEPYLRPGLDARSRRRHLAGPLHARGVRRAGQAFQLVC